MSKASPSIAPKSPAGEAPRLGHRVRALRRRGNLSQVQLAERLGVSPSYLNLIEHDKRPLPAPMLIQLAELFEVDLGYFSSDEGTLLVSDLYEVFADPLFESRDLTSVEVREFAQQSTPLARAVLALYRAYQETRTSVDSLASRVTGDGDGQGLDRSLLPSEQVNDFVQTHQNHFPELEEGAESVWRDAKLDGDDLYSGLVRYLEKRHKLKVRVARWDDEKGLLRRLDADQKTIVLSELLPTRSRSFQLAHQLALLEQRAVLDRAVQSALLTGDESRTLSRVAMANYFAGAVLMPYERFLRAAQKERYDIEVLGRRFRVGFEQVCHRLTTLQRPGAEGVPFHMIRIDVAGNISKKFSASGIRFARFSGACPKWNVFQAFMTPGMIRIQLSRMTDGAAYFCLARTIQKDSGGYHAQQPVLAIGLGCRLEHARELVYADGVDLSHAEAIVPVGVTCRLCERTDCEQRAHPSMRHPLRIDENVRRLSIYASAPESPGERS